ncbi:unnamed protein product [Polarella glacialis]|uniref:Uncharacterized protein n=1 Tax=Polarella glacialis TaxID=89957 RepID=A0A813FAZ4_POLGL|nr:unnamed protein product [Polarella glacialis]
MDTYSCHNSVYYDQCRQPIAVLAMDAVYGQSPLHKFFHLASLFVLDDGKVGFMFVFADNLEDIMWQDQNLFQGVILIGDHLCELMSAASSLFGCSPWIMSAQQLLWFGLDIAQDDHYDKAWLALRQGLSSHTDLAELQEWIEYDLHPGYVPVLRNGNDFIRAIDEETASEVAATQLKVEHLARLFNHGNNNSNNNRSCHRVLSACTK